MEQTYYEFCPKCGHQNSNSNNYCANCGTSLNIEENSMYTNEDILNYVGENATYYIPKFQEMEFRFKKTSWNWAALFFGAVWLIYRKMYLYAAAYMISITTLAFLLPVILPYLNLAFYICIALYGNSLYFHKLKKDLKLLSSVDPIIKQSAIISKGGTNILVATLAVLLIIGCISFL